MEKGHIAGKGMALEEKGMALGKRGMARRHAKRGWGKHYMHLHINVFNLIDACPSPASFLKIIFLHEFLFVSSLTWGLLL